MPYPIILNGDHAEFEMEYAGVPKEERPDWPLPSFDAVDWAKAFCKIATDLGYKDAEGKPVDEAWMVGWFANSLMRGFDEHVSRGKTISEVRWGIKNKNQLPFLMVWREHRACGEVEHGDVIFNSRDWIGF